MKRRRAFRVFALCLPLLAVTLLELVLRLANWGYSASFFLPTHEARQTTLIENSKFARRFFPPSVARTPQPVVLTAKKPAAMLRIVVFGESAAMGDPEPSYGFARQLECILSASYPNKQVQVVNAAMTAIDSEVMVQIARDAAQIESDYWVVYAGNNEVIGPFGASSILGYHRVPQPVLQAILALKSLRVWQFVESLTWLGREAPEWQGMEAFLGLQVRRDDSRLKALYGKFAANLGQVVQLGEKAGAKVLLATMPVNLKDSPPFGSLHRLGLTAAQGVEWDRHFNQGVQEQNAGRFAEALEEFQQAFEIDPQYAELAFRIGECERALGKGEDALRHFRLARDFDTLRFRADSNINQVIRQTAQLDQVIPVDAEALCASVSSDHLPGADLFYDHVHLNFTGNFAIATVLATEIRKADQKGQSSPQPERLSEEEVARRLAFTDFDRRRIAEEMRARLQQAPFRQQSNFLKRDEDWHKFLAGLNGSPREFVPQYEAALRLRPHDWVLHANFARLLEAEGDNAGTAAQWEEVTHLLPHYADAWLSRAGVLGNTGRYAEAESACQEARKRSADPAQVLNQLGLLASAQGEHRRAERLFNKALRSRPGSSVARINLAAELADLGDFGKATNQYWEVIRRDPSNIGARNNLGGLLLRQGDDEDALKLFQEALQVDGEHPQTHYNLARLFAQRGQHNEAVRHYQMAVQVRPEFAQAQLGLGLELAALGQQAEALERFAETARLAPDWVDARFNYGVSLAKAHRYVEASEQFEAALKLQPNHPSARKALDRARELAQRSSPK